MSEGEHKKEEGKGGKVRSVAPCCSATLLCTSGDPELFVVHPAARCWPGLQPLSEGIKSKVPGTVAWAEAHEGYRVPGELQLAHVACRTAGAHERCQPALALQLAHADSLLPCRTLAQTPSMARPPPSPSKLRRSWRWAAALQALPVALSMRSGRRQVADGATATFGGQCF